MQSLRNTFLLSALCLLGWSARLSAQAPDTIHFKLCAEFWKDAKPMRGATLVFQPINPSFPYPPIVFELDSTLNCADVDLTPSDYLPGTSFSYTGWVPGLENEHLSGLSVFDLCITARHILGVEPLSSPYAYFAADVNKSGSITTFDLVEERKLLLGIYTELPNNQPWRFFPDYCKFPNPANPFMNLCASSIDMDELMLLDGDTARVIGVKVGDTSGDAVFNGSGPAAAGADTVNLVIPAAPVTAFTQALAPVFMDTTLQISGIQVSFRIDPALAQFNDILPGSLPITPSNFSYNATTGVLRFSYLNTMNDVVQDNVPMFKIQFTPKVDGNISDMVEIYDDEVMESILGGDCGEEITIGNLLLFVATSSETPFNTGLNLSGPSPNPFNNEAFWDIQTEHPEKARLEVLDLSGRLLYTEQRMLPAGATRWTLNAGSIGQKGMLTWRITSGGKIAAGKMIRE